MNKVTLPPFQQNNTHIRTLENKNESFVKETEKKLSDLKAQYSEFFKIFDEISNPLSKYIEPFKRRVVTEITQMTTCLHKMESYEHIATFQKRVQFLIEETLELAPSVTKEGESIIAVTESLLELNQSIVNKVIDLCQ